MCVQVSLILIGSNIAPLCSNSSDTLCMKSKIRILLIDLQEMSSINYYSLLIVKGLFLCFLNLVVLSLYKKIAPKKFMQVEVDEVYMCTKIGRCSLSNFEDFAPFVLLQKRPNFRFGSPWSWKKFNCLESTHKIHPCICSYDMHAHQFWWV